MVFCYSSYNNILHTLKEPNITLNLCIWTVHIVVKCQFQQYFIKYGGRIYCLVKLEQQAETTDLSKLVSIIPNYSRWIETIA
jgi:hypothetical protein